MAGHGVECVVVCGEEEPGVDSVVGDEVGPGAVVPQLECVRVSADALDRRGDLRVLDRSVSLRNLRGLVLVLYENKLYNI